MENITKQIQNKYRERLITLDSMQPDYGRAIEITQNNIDLLRQYNNIPKFKSIIEYNGKTLYLNNINGNLVYIEKDGGEIFIPPSYYEHIAREQQFLMLLQDNLQLVRQRGND